MRKRTRRKVWSVVNPVMHAIEGAALIPQKELDALRLRELAALEAFRVGKAGLEEWHDITAYMKLCEVLAEDGGGSSARAGWV